MSLWEVGPTAVTSWLLQEVEERQWGTGRRSEGLRQRPARLPRADDRRGKEEGEGEDCCSLEISAAGFRFSGVFFSPVQKGSSWEDLVDS